MRQLRLMFLALLAVVTAPVPMPAQPTGRASDRQHHYVFAHRVMPRLFYRDATKLLNALAERRAELLRAMWVDLGEQFFPTAQVAPDGLDVIVPPVRDGVRMVVLVFPAPAASAEAYFAALVAGPDGTLRYLTLERAIDLAGADGPATVLGGWDAEGAYLSFGEGSPPIVEEFERRVRALLAQPAGNSAAGKKALRRPGARLSLPVHSSGGVAEWSKAGLC